VGSNNVSYCGKLPESKGIVRVIDLFWHIVGTLLQLVY